MMSRENSRLQFHRHFRNKLTFIICNLTQIRLNRIDTHFHSDRKLVTIHDTKGGRSQLRQLTLFNS